MPNLDKNLKTLADEKISCAIKDKKDRVWILLLSDIVFPQFFPEYMVDVIRRRWKEGTIQKEIAIKHLELLRAEYIATQAPKFRKKILQTIRQIFSQTEKAVNKGDLEQAATMADQIANYCRDMGERPTGEMVDQVSKGLREDKEKYVEQNWEADRVKVLEMIQEIEERDKAKEAAMKGQKGAKKKASKKPEKKADKKGKAPPPDKKKPDKKDTKKGKEAPEEGEPQEAPAEEEPEDTSAYERKIKTETAKATFTKREREAKPEEKMADIHPRNLCTYI